MKDILRRAWRVALFDRGPLREALWESSATADAALLVIVVSGVVALALAFQAGLGVTSIVSVLLSEVISRLALWLFLAVATWFVGSRLFTPQDDHRRRFDYVQTMLRMHGLAFLPIVLTAVGGLAGGLVAAVAQLWYLAVAAVGTSIALDSKTWEGAVAVLLGAAVIVVIRMVLGAPFAILGGLF